MLFGAVPGRHTVSWWEDATGRPLARAEDESCSCEIGRDHDQDDWSVEQLAAGRAARGS